MIGALTARTATDAVDRIIDQTPPERRPKVQLALAENLRGIVAQVLLRKAGGGRVAAREVLLNTSAVANFIAEGKTSQLPMALDSGRKHGMVALNDALVAFVQGGIVESREAYRQAADQQGFLALLKRQGIDTSFVERPLPFHKRAEFFQQSLQDVFLGEMFDRRAALDRSLVLHEAAAARAAHAQERERLVL